MQIIENYTKQELLQALKRPVFDSDDLSKTVEEIFYNIQDKGDEALKYYTQKFDKVELNNLRVNEEEIEKAVAETPIELKQAINLAKSNIKKFHAAQFQKYEKIETTKGVYCWQKNVPIQKVGLYIPGGTAPLCSTVLMLAVPAKLAGCDEIILCSPPDSDGRINPAIIYTAYISGATKIFKAGGIQAIAAMTFGTESIGKVYKIFGPGNQYVTAAKQYAQKFGVSIDLPAGPSEVMIIADDSALPEFVAADLLSQAEHGEDSQVILVCHDIFFAEKTLIEVKNQLDKLPRKSIAKKCLENSKMIISKNKTETVEIINEYAPEHLILSTSDNDFYINKVKNAGSVFIGNFTPESAGDYASGTNHTLPTNGYAKTYSGVTLDSFNKKITFQEITSEGILNLGRTIEIMAETEQLQAHKNAVSIRLSKLNKTNSFLK